MDELYQSLKFVHIAAAMLWIGGLFALAVITARLARASPQAFAAIRQQSRFFGQAIVGPAAGLTLLAGLVMVGRAGWSFSSLWVIWGVTGIAVSLLLGAFPIRLLGNEADALAATAPSSPRLAGLQSRLTWVSALNLLVLASVIWAMVVKP